MNAFIDLTGEEQILELVSFTATLLGDEDPNFEANCQAKIGTGGATEVLSDLIGHSNKFYGGGQDITSILNSISRLLCMLKPEETNALVKLLAQSLASEENVGHEQSRMKILGNLFNNLKPNSSSRFDAYIALLELAGRTGSIDAVSISFSRLDGWVAEWQITNEQCRVLYETLHRITLQQNLTKESAAFLTKLLEYYSGDAESLKASKAFAKKLIGLSLADPELFNMESIIRLKAVQNLQSEKCFELFSVFQSGNLGSYQTWAAANSPVFGELGLDEGEMLRKIRLLSLAYLCAENTSVDFSAVATALGVENADVEMWIIDVIRVGLVEAKVDQVNQRVHVNRSKCTKFDQSQWEELRNRLTGWSKNLAQCQRVMKTVKLQIDEASKAPRLGR